MLIGLVGLKGSGKDSLTNTLINKYGDKFVNLKFADGIKQILRDYFYIPPSIYEDANLKEARIVNGTRFTVRELMIRIGQFYRSINPDFWVDYTMAQYLELSSKNPNHIYIITDARFPNEINAIYKHGGVILDVNRSDLFRTEKRIINHCGVNCLSKALIRYINSSLVDPSEWNYFILRNKYKFPVIDNTDFKLGVQNFEDFIWNSLKQ